MPNASDAADLASATPHVEVSFDAKASAQPLTWRLLVILSNDASEYGVRVTREF